MKLVFASKPANAGVSIKRECAKPQEKCRFGDEACEAGDSQWFAIGMTAARIRGLGAYLFRSPGFRTVALHPGLYARRPHPRAKNEMRVSSKNLGNDKSDGRVTDTCTLLISESRPNFYLMLILTGLAGLPFTVSTTSTSPRPARLRGIRTLI